MKNKIIKFVILILTTVVLSGCNKNNTENVNAEYKYLTNNNIDYLTSKSYDEFVKKIYDNKQDYYIDYIKNKYKNKLEYKYNYTKDDKFRFISGYKKSYIPAYDCYKYGNFEETKYYKELWEYDIYGLVDVFDVDLDEDGKKELLIFEIKKNEKKEDSLYNLCFFVLSYDDKVMESNEIRLNENDFEFPSFDINISYRKVNDDILIYSHSYQSSDHMGDAYPDEIDIYKYENNEILLLDNICLDNDVEGYEAEENKIKKYLFDTVDTSNYFYNYNNLINVNRQNVSKSRTDYSASMRDDGYCYVLQISSNKFFTKYK